MKPRGQKKAFAPAHLRLSPGVSGLSENLDGVREPARGRVLGDVLFEKRRNRTLGALVHCPANGRAVSAGELYAYFQGAGFELAQSHGEIPVPLCNALLALKTLIQLPSQVCDLGFKSRGFGTCVLDAPLQARFEFGRSSFGPLCGLALLRQLIAQFL